MLGLILIYFIGKHFYQLAEEFNKHKWGFAILGVVVYYSGILIGQFTLIMFLEFFTETNIDNMNILLIALLGIPVGLLFIYLLSKYLRKTWQFQGDKIQYVDILDEDLIDDEL